MRLWRPGLLRFRRYGGKGSKDSPKKKRRPSGYILFTSAERQKMQGTHWATESQKEIMKELARRWRDEPQATKDEWNRRAKELPSPRVASPPKSKPVAQSKPKKAVSKKAKGKKKKPSGSPKKRTPSGYILFTSAERQKMQGTQWATEPQKEIMKELASRWRDAPQATKDEWNERAKQVSSPAVASPPKVRPGSPLKANKAASKKAGSKKEAPSGEKKKRKPSGYILFVSAAQKTIKAEGQDVDSDGNKMKPKDLMRVVAASWKALSQEQRDDWNERARAARSPLRSPSRPHSASRPPKKVVAGTSGYQLYLKEAVHRMKNNGAAYNLHTGDPYTEEELKQEAIRMWNQMGEPAKEVYNVTAKERRGDGYQLYIKEEMARMKQAGSDYDPRLRARFSDEELAAEAAIGWDYLSQITKDAWNARAQKALRPGAGRPGTKPASPKSPKPSSKPPSPKPATKKRTVSAYMTFVAHMRSELKKNGNVDDTGTKLAHKEILKYIGARWRELSGNAKLEWAARAKDMPSPLTAEQKQANAKVSAAEKAELDRLYGPIVGDRYRGLLVRKSPSSGANRVFLGDKLGDASAKRYVPDLPQYRNRSNRPQLEELPTWEQYVDLMKEVEKRSPKVLKELREIMNQSRSALESSDFIVTAVGSGLGSSDEFSLKKLDSLPLCTLPQYIQQYAYFIDRMATAQTELEGAEGADAAEMAALEKAFREAKDDYETETVVAKHVAEAAQAQLKRMRLWELGGSQAESMRSSSAMSGRDSVDISGRNSAMSVSTSDSRSTTPVEFMGGAKKKPAQKKPTSAKKKPGRKAEAVYAFQGMPGFAKVATSFLTKRKQSGDMEFTKECANGETDEGRRLFLHQAIDRQLLNPLTPMRRSLVLAATGTGKATIALNVIDAYFQDTRPKVVFVPSYSHALSYVADMRNLPRTSLLRQWLHGYEKSLKEGDWRKISGEKTYEEFRETQMFDWAVLAALQFKRVVSGKSTTRAEEVALKREEEQRKAEMLAAKQDAKLLAPSSAEADEEEEEEEEDEEDKDVKPPDMIVDTKREEALLKMLGRTTTQLLDQWYTTPAEVGVHAELRAPIVIMPYSRHLITTYRDVQKLAFTVTRSNEPARQSTEKLRKDVAAKVVEHQAKPLIAEEVPKKSDDNYETKLKALAQKYEVEPKGGLHGIHLNVIAKIKSDVIAKALPPQDNTREERTALVRIAKEHGLIGEAISFDNMIVLVDEVQMLIHRDAAVGLSSGTKAKIFGDDAIKQKMIDEIEELKGRVGSRVYTSSDRDELRKKKSKLEIYKGLADLLFRAAGATVVGLTATPIAGDKGDGRKETLNVKWSQRTKNDAGVLQWIAGVKDVQGAQTVRAFNAVQKERVANKAAAPKKAKKPSDDGAASPSKMSKAAQARQKKAEKAELKAAAEEADFKRALKPYEGYASYFVSRPPALFAETHVRTKGGKLKVERSSVPLPRIMPIVVTLNEDDMQRGAHQKFPQYGYGSLAELQKKADAAEAAEEWLQTAKTVEPVPTEAMRKVVKDFTTFIEYEEELEEKKPGEAQTIVEAKARAAFENETKGVEIVVNPSHPLLRHKRDAQGKAKEELEPIGLYAVEDDIPRGWSEGRALEPVAMSAPEKGDVVMCQLPQGRVYGVLEEKIKYNKRADLLANPHEKHDGGEKMVVVPGVLHTFNHQLKTKVKLAIGKPVIDVDAIKKFEVGDRDVVVGKQRLPIVKRIPLEDLGSRQPRSVSVTFDKKKGIEVSGTKEVPVYIYFIHAGVAYLTPNSTLESKTVRVDQLTYDPAHSYYSFKQLIEPGYISLFLERFNKSEGKKVLSTLYGSKISRTAQAYVIGGNRYLTNKGSSKVPCDAIVGLGSELRTNETYRGFAVDMARQLVPEACEAEGKSLWLLDESRGLALVQKWLSCPEGARYRDQVVILGRYFQSIDISKRADDLLKKFNRKINARGKKAKLFIGGASHFGTGITFTELRRVYLDLTPSYANLLQQIGRAIRLCKHRNLEAAERFVEFHLPVPVFIKRGVDEEGKSTGSTVWDSRPKFEELMDPDEDDESGKQLTELQAKKKLAVQEPAHLGELAVEMDNFVEKYGVGEPAHAALYLYVHVPKTVQHTLEKMLQSQRAFAQGMQAFGDVAVDTAFYRDELKESGEKVHPEPKPKPLLSLSEAKEMMSEMVFDALKETPLYKTGLSQMRALSSANKRANEAALKERLDERTRPQGEARERHLFRVRKEAFDKAQAAKAAAAKAAKAAKAAAKDASA